MKKYIILTALILLSFSVQAKEKGFLENLNSAKKQESTFSREEMQGRRNAQLERMKEHYNKKYANLSKEELEKNKKRLEQTIKSAEKGNKRRFQAELDVVNSLLEQQK